MRDLFGAALGIAAMSASPSFLGDEPRRRPWEPSRIDDSKVIHTPKPLGKRAKRRLRGKHLTPSSD